MGKSRKAPPRKELVIRKFRSFSDWEKRKGGPHAVFKKKAEDGSTKIVAIPRGKGNLSPGVWKDVLVKSEIPEEKFH